MTDSMIISSLDKLITEEMSPLMKMIDEGSSLWPGKILNAVDKFLNLKTVPRAESCFFVSKVTTNMKFQIYETNICILILNGTLK